MAKNIVIIDPLTDTGKSTTIKMKSIGWNVIGVGGEENNKDVDRYYRCDIKRRDEMMTLAEEIEADIGPVDALYTAVEKTDFKNFEAMSSKEWGEALDYVLGGTVNSCAAFVPAMKERREGRVALLSPDFRYIEGDCILAAAASGSIYGFAKSFGVEVAPDNVMVNIISPNLPYVLDSISETISFLIERGNYISSQVVSIVGKEQVV